MNKHLKALWRKLTILNPEQLGQRPQHGSLVLELKLGVAQNGLDEDVVHESQEHAHVNKLNVERVLPAQSYMHPSDFVEVLPELHLCGVGAELAEVAPEEHLAILDLRGIEVGYLIDGSVIVSRAGSKGTGRDVVGEEFLVNNIDNGGNQCLEGLGNLDESCAVLWEIC